jgi:hypothetical protein
MCLPFASELRKVKYPWAPHATSSSGRLAVRSALLCAAECREYHPTVRDCPHNNRVAARAARLARRLHGHIRQSDELPRNQRHVSVSESSACAGCAPICPTAPLAKPTDWPGRNGGDPQWHAAGLRAFGGLALPCVRMHANARAGAPTRTKTAASLVIHRSQLRDRAAHTGLSVARTVLRRMRTQLQRIAE